MHVDAIVSKEETMVIINGYAGPSQGTYSNSQITAYYIIDFIQKQSFANTLMQSPEPKSHDSEGNRLTGIILDNMKINISVCIKC